ncbi:hypothetical protein AJ79_03011 [Helicocarpus griseus UAMH5409]|uniref:Uncharacterized protein n=1 Tax=Helicocarpus griseus UAMH5409 TaxID=1447875 RepID=A0A2B7Y138_9EURO|nr:hypothetical protein AJ79_03011 [Helicocarpus griseus UAMH5409]
MSLIMDEANQKILNTVEEERTIRIVVDVPTNILQHDNILSAASSLVRPLVEEWEKNNNSTRLLVVDVYPRHTYIVIDVNNWRYDYSIAHQQTFPIPVYVLRLSKRSNQWVFFRRATEDQKIATTLAELHRCNGVNPTPFFADHIRGSVYLSPRTT